MFSKYVKTKSDNDIDNKEKANDNVDNSDNEDEIENVKLKNNNEINELINKELNDNVDISDIVLPNLNDMYGIKCVDKNIANITIEELKNTIHSNNIKSIRDYGKFSRNNKSPIINPQNDFRREWISWSDF